MREYIKQLLRDANRDPGRWDCVARNRLRYRLTDAFCLDVTGAAICQDAHIHTHPWSFERTVFSGHVTSVAYAVAGTGERYYAQNARQGEPYGEARPVRLNVLRTGAWHAPETFARASWEAHRDTAAPGTVTFSARRYLPRGDTTVYLESGDVWHVPTPRAATLEEVETITTYALKGMT